MHFFLQKPRRNPQYWKGKAQPVISKSWNRCTIGLFKQLCFQISGFTKNTWLNGVFCLPADLPSFDMADIQKTLRAKGSNITKIATFEDS